MRFRHQLAFYLDDLETPINISINLISLTLTLLSLGIFIIGTYDISLELQNYLRGLDTIILVILTLEFLLRFYSSENRLSFIFSLFGLIDLITILPLITIGWDIRFFRIFRWFRILRLIRLLKFKLFIFKIEQEDSIILARIILTLVSIIFVYSGMIYQVEHQVNPEIFHNFFDALYFSIVTMTTVGFGDVTPISSGGRILTLLMILTGVFLIPWQAGELIKQFLKTSKEVEAPCLGCGLAFHDGDAQFCKRCGTALSKIKSEVDIRQPVDDYLRNYSKSE